jgi:hypothetical protein
MDNIPKRKDPFRNINPSEIYAQMHQSDFSAWEDNDIVGDVELHYSPDYDHTHFFTHKFQHNGITYQVTRHLNDTDELNTMDDIEEYQYHIEKFLNNSKYNPDVPQLYRTSVCAISQG